MYPCIEPTEDWTIEELLQWRLLQSELKTNQTRDELINSLKQQFETGQNELWKLHQTAVESQKRFISDEIVDPANEELQDIEKNDENKNPTSVNHNVASHKKEIIKKSTSSGTCSVIVEIKSGPYDGSNFILRPRLRKPCFVGRSAGKKFRERGISLPKDSEVSTTHGKFELKNGGKIYFTDTGSTNGTLYKGIELEVNVPLELEEGMELLVGTSVLKIGFDSNE